MQNLGIWGEIVRRDENFVVESAVFEVADSHFSVHFETLKGCDED